MQQCSLRENRPAEDNERLRVLFLQAVLDVLDVFFSQIQEPAGRRGIGDLTGQPSALLDLFHDAVCNG